MGLDFITLILIGFVLIYLVVTRVKMYMEHMKELDIAKERKDMQKIFTGQVLYTVYAIVMIASIIGIIFVYLNPGTFEDPQSWMLVFAIIFTVIAIDIIRVKILYTTYYNDHGMFSDKDYIRYNSIKRYNQKKIPIMTEVILFNNQTYMIPTKTLTVLKDKIHAKRKK